MKKQKPQPKLELAPPPAAPAEQPQQPADEWCDDRELAVRTPLSRPFWQTLRARRKGPAYYRVGKRCLYKWHEVVAWLESKRTEPKAS